ncbi:MAG TPA: hypothetical protein VFB34_13195 [Chloroflexota bacterium]|nr:hypothetical protein [Chloroflexota bacterium]
MDMDIVDAGSLIALLLVFVFAYFSALLPMIEDARRRPKPAARDDLASLLRTLSSYRLLTSGLLAVIVLVLAVLGLCPGTWSVRSFGSRSERCGSRYCL